RRGGRRDRVRDRRGDRGRRGRRRRDPRRTRRARQLSDRRARRRGQPCRRRGLRRLRPLGGRAGDLAAPRILQPVTAVHRSRALPVPLRIAAYVATIFFLLPLIGLCWRTPWAQLLERLADDAIVEALLLSLQCSFAAALLSALLGLPLAAWLAQGR